MEQVVAYKTKSQSIYGVLRELIMRGQYPEGQIFNSVELAKKYGVSRTPVIEAIKLLEAKGFVKILPGVGFEVRKPSAAEIFELLEIRGTLEGLALKKAILNCTAQDVSALKKILHALEDCLKTKNREEYLRLNEEFHFSLYELSKYSRLVFALRELWDYEGWYANALHENTEDLRLLMDDHWKIVLVLEEKDLQQCACIIEEHWRHCVEVLQKNIKHLGGVQA